MKIRLTEAEKKARKERKRVLGIKREIGNQSGVIQFHELFTYVGYDGTTKIKEVNAAIERIAELRKQL